MANSPSPRVKTNTLAHLVETAGHHLAHTLRHWEDLGKSKTQAEKDLNYEHLGTHLKGGIEHVQKIMEHLKDNYPKEGKELTTLEATIPQSERDRVTKKAASIGQGKNI